MFQFYNKNDKVRITDLHQGVVWGTQTSQTILHEDLINRFDYDGIFGTVLNRFIVQSQVNHPITIYGTGGQTRAFIHMQNTTECVKLALENPPKTGEKYRVFNQTTECHNIKILAKVEYTFVPKSSPLKYSLISSLLKKLVINTLSLKCSP